MDRVAEGVNLGPSPRYPVSRAGDSGLCREGSWRVFLRGGDNVFGLSRKYYFLGVRSKCPWQKELHEQMPRTHIVVALRSSSMTSVQ